MTQSTLDRPRTSTTVPEPAHSLRRLLERIWRERTLMVAVAVAVAAVYGVAAGLWTPRGPLTRVDGVVTVVLSLVVGCAAGLVMRSRWALLAAPAAFAISFEMTRLGVTGPTVDAPRFTEYGIIAFVVGRGIHGLLALLPMMLGAALGVALARRIAADRAAIARPTLVGRITTVLAALLVPFVTAMVLRPATTDPITGPDGEALPGSIAEITSVDINGHDLAMMIRGHDVENPVLLFLAGGPGGSEMGAMRNHLSALEEHFVVVTWDQRGTGKSYPALDPTSTLTLESVIDDTIAVTSYLRDRFNQDQIYLLGQSWGSTLGILAVQQRPDLYAAYIGTGQMVSQLATDRIFYEDTLAWALSTGNDGLVGTLEQSGPPPYETVLSYESALKWEHEVYPFDSSLNDEGEGGFSENLFVEEYTFLEQIHALGAMLDTFTVLYPQLQEIDFRTDATSFDVPMYFVQGAHEAGGRAAPFAEWYPMIDAPVKELVVLDTSGHRPLFQQPDEFTEFMVTTVPGR
jgi:pimeloyl-ACP methyl ester carboxylesterase